MDGVVFDFDGVIAASMGLHAEAYRRVLEPLGVPVSDREVYLREGARSETIIRDLAEAADVSFGADRVAALADEKQQVFRSLGPARLYPGADAMVRDVAGRAPVALVTGTRRENLDALIPDLLPVFAAVMSQESYTHDKPHPEPYANAAAALGIDPARLVCVENAARGVDSAKAAGYGSVQAVCTTLAEADLADADAVHADHAALSAALRVLV